MNLFERLREERERLGYSQTAFAALADASKHAQINWEKGTASPNAAALMAWAAAGMDVLYVVTGEHSSPAVQPLPADEQMWLDCYRGWDMPVKRKELARALGLSPTDGLERAGTSKGGANTEQNFHGAVRGGVAGRDIVQTGKAGKR